MMETFILRWGYLAIVAGTFFEGEAILIAGGALAHRGILFLPDVILAAFLGSIVDPHLGRRDVDAFEWLQRGIERRRPWLQGGGVGTHGACECDRLYGLLIGQRMLEPHLLQIRVRPSATDHGAIAMDDRSQQPWMATP